MGPRLVTRTRPRQDQAGDDSPGLHRQPSGSAGSAALVGYIPSVAEFTPKSVQTEELRTNLVYEVRVLVKDAGNVLRLGQPATVTVPWRSGRRHE